MVHKPHTWGLMGRVLGPKCGVTLQTRAGKHPGLYPGVREIRIYSALSLTGDGRGGGSPSEFTGMGSAEMTDPRLHLGAIYF